MLCPEGSCLEVIRLLWLLNSSVFCSVNLHEPWEVGFDIDVPQRAKCATSVILCTFALCASLC